MMQILLAALFGLIIGSFLNVVIHRIPKAIEANDNDLYRCLLWPSSTAPCCNTTLSWYENIPLFSWLWLRGRCRHCDHNISPRYLFVEVLTAVAYGWVAWQFGIEPVAFVYALFLTLLICLFFIDLETFLLPDCLTLSLLWLGLLASALGIIPIAPQDAILGACLGYLLPWSVNRIYRLVRGHDGFGGGDFKLLAALGVWTGWINILPILGVASVTALIVIGLSILGKARKLSMQQALPFGPFLIFAGLCLLVARS